MGKVPFYFISKSHKMSPSTNAKRPQISLWPFCVIRNDHKTILLDQWICVQQDQRNNQTINSNRLGKGHTKNHEGH